MSIGFGIFELLILAGILLAGVVIVAVLAVNRKG